MELALDALETHILISTIEAIKHTHFTKRKLFPPDIYCTWKAVPSAARHPLRHRPGCVICYAALAQYQQEPVFRDFHRIHEGRLYHLELNMSRLRGNKDSWLKTFQKNEKWINILKNKPKLLQNWKHLISIHV